MFETLPWNTSLKNESDDSADSKCEQTRDRYAELFMSRTVAMSPVTPKKSEQKQKRKNEGIHWAVTMFDDSLVDAAVTMAERCGAGVPVLDYRSVAKLKGPTIIPGLPSPAEPFAAAVGYKSTSEKKVRRLILPTFTNPVAPFAAVPELRRLFWVRKPEKQATIRSGGVLYNLPVESQSECLTGEALRTARDAFAADNKRFLRVAVVRKARSQLVAEGFLAFQDGKKEDLPPESWSYAISLDNEAEVVAEKVEAAGEPVSAVYAEPGEAVGLDDKGVAHKLLYTENVFLVEIVKFPRLESGYSSARLVAKKAKADNPFNRSDDELEAVWTFKSTQHGRR